MFLNLFIWIIWFSFIASFPCKHVQMTFFHAGRISYFKVRFCMLHHYFKIAFPLTVTLQNVLHKITYSFIMDGSFLSEIYLVILVRFSSLVWDIFKLWCIFIFFQNIYHKENIPPPSSPKPVFQNYISPRKGKFYM